MESKTKGEPAHYIEIVQPSKPASMSTLLCSSILVVTKCTALCDVTVAIWRSHYVLTRHSRGGGRCQRIREPRLV